jgi:tetratricopeptide (TPR) repeat protein
MEKNMSTGASQNVLTKRSGEVRCLPHARKEEASCALSAEAAKVPIVVASHIPSAYTSPINLMQAPRVMPSSLAPYHAQMLHSLRIRLLKTIFSKATPRTATDTPGPVEIMCRILHLKKSDKFIEAIIYINQLDLSKFPKNFQASVWHQKGKCYFYSKGFHYAIQCYEKARPLNNDPEFLATVCYDCASALIAIGESDKALDCIKEAKELAALNQSEILASVYLVLAQILIENKMSASMIRADLLNALSFVQNNLALKEKIQSLLRQYPLQVEV